MTDPYVEDEINLRDCWRVLVRRRFLILGITFGVAFVTVIFTLLQPNVYQSKTALMPLGKASSGLRGVLGDLEGLLPIGSIDQESPTERLSAILRSRTLAEEVIHRLDLIPRLFAREWDVKKQQWITDEPPTMQDAVRALQNDLVNIASNKNTGVITITVEHTDPELAAAIANQHVDVLQHRLNVSAFSLAKKNRLFIESQLQKTKRDLATAEEALRQFEQQHQIIALDAQAKAAVDAIAFLDSQIRAKEIQLAVLQRSVTGASQEVTLLQEELQGLRTQLAELQRGDTSKSGYGIGSTQSIRAFPAFADAPEIKLEYTRLQREAQIQNKLFGLLVQQLEQAKIEEARDGTAFQVLDRAIPAEKRIRPKRRQSVILATVIGAFLGIIVVFFREFLDTTIHTREQVERKVRLPVLVVISPAKLKSRWRRRLKSYLHPGTAQCQSQGTASDEAYYYLRSRLKYLSSDRHFQTVLLTSPGPENAAPTTVIHLAFASADRGEKTLLVDGDIRNPTLQKLLCCPGAPGLIDNVTDPDEWKKGIQTTSIDNLDFLPAGIGTIEAFTHWEYPGFDDLLIRFKKAYDLILFVAPPVLSSADTTILGAKVDAICLVLTFDVTKIESAVEARMSLESIQGNVIGTVLTYA